MYEVRFFEDQHWLDRARFMVVQRYNNGDIEVVRPDGTRYIYQNAPGVERQWADEDFFVIPLDALTSLHSQLTKKMRLDGIDDSQSLREDYNAERERVDTLMGLAIRIADSSVQR
jgi:hypothetical protein